LLSNKRITVIRTRHSEAGKIWGRTNAKVSYCCLSQLRDEHLSRITKMWLGTGMSPPPAALSHHN